MIRVFLVLALFFTPIQAQLTSFRTFIDSSYNNEYKVYVSADFYEGFFGSQKIRLVSKDDKVLWEKSFDGNSLSFPLVSNNGVVAVINDNNLSFFDRESNLIGEYILPEDNFFSYLEENASFSNFSIDGNLYLVIVSPRQKNIRKIVYMNVKADTSWTYNLNEFFAKSLTCFENGFALHAFIRDGREYTNRFYFCKYTGKVRFLYEPEDKNSVYRFYYDPDRDTFNMGYKYMKVVRLNNK